MKIYIDYIFNVVILVVILCCHFARCYCWRKLGRWYTIICLYYFFNHWTWIYSYFNIKVKFKKGIYIWIIGAPEGEEEEQKIENLLEQIMKENFLHLAKEIAFQEVQEAQRVPKKLDPRRNTPRHIIITLPKIRWNRRRES